MRLFLIISVFISLLANVCSLGCLDEDGNLVDSWTVVKAAYKTFDYFVRDGSTWTLSPYSLDQDKDGCVMRTVQQIYSPSESLATGLYNDEAPPDYTASSSYAHSKGVLASSSSQGFWLVHTMPHWPNNLSMPSPGPFPDETYGQSLLCVTISSGVADNISSNLLINRPWIYSQSISDELRVELPKFSQWLDHEYNVIDTNAQMPFKSVGGQQYFQMAKSKYWKQDLWDDMVAPYFETAITVETWRNGAGGRMGSICGEDGPKSSTYDVIEVSAVQMPNNSSWTGTQDHSKWCVATSNSSFKKSGAGPVSVSVPFNSTSLSSQSFLSCVGDINRMCSQESRGGGALCLEDQGSWEAFTSIIAGVESCWQYDPCAGTSTHCYWCPVPVPEPTTLPTSTPLVADSSWALKVV